MEYYCPKLLILIFFYVNLDLEQLEPLFVFFFLWCHH